MPHQPGYVRWQCTRRRDMSRAQTVAHRARAHREHSGLLRPSVCRRDRGHGRKPVGINRGGAQTRSGRGDCRKTGRPSGRPGWRTLPVVPEPGNESTVTAVPTRSSRTACLARALRQQWQTALAGDAVDQPVAKSSSGVASLPERSRALPISLAKSSDGQHRRPG